MLGTRYSCGVGVCQGIPAVKSRAQSSQSTNGGDKHKLIPTSHACVYLPATALCQAPCNSIQHPALASRNQRFAVTCLRTQTGPWAACRRRRRRPLMPAGGACPWAAVRSQTRAIELVAAQHANAQSRAARGALGQASPPARGRPRPVTAGPAPCRTTSGCGARRAGGAGPCGTRRRAARGWRGPARQPPWGVGGLEGVEDPPRGRGTACGAGG